MDIAKLIGSRDRLQVQAKANKCRKVQLRHAKNGGMDEDEIAHARRHPESAQAAKLQQVLHLAAAGRKTRKTTALMSTTELLERYRASNTPAEFSHRAEYDAFATSRKTHIIVL